MSMPRPYLYFASRTMRSNASARTCTRASTPGCFSQNGCIMVPAITLRGGLTDVDLGVVATAGAAAYAAAMLVRKVRRLATGSSSIKAILKQQSMTPEQQFAAIRETLAFISAKNAETSAKNAETALRLNEVTVKLDAVTANLDEAGV